MYYFLTDNLGKDWQGRQWGEGVLHKEENPNYYFICYRNPLVALFMNPAFDDYKDPQIWLAEPSGEQMAYDFRHISTELKVVRQIPVPVLTVDQRIAFGIVCALNVVPNKVFADWGVAWLKGDRSLERVRALEAVLMEQMFEDFVGPAHAACAGVLGDPELYAACAAHRAYCDSREMNLGEMATIVTMLTPEEIGQMLAEEQGEQGTNDTGPHPGNEIGLRETSLPDGEQAGPTQDMDQGRPEDVRHGSVLPGSEEEVAASPPERGNSADS